MCVKCGRLVHCKYKVDSNQESDDETREAMVNGLEYLTNVGDKYSIEEFESLLDHANVDNALFMLYQATLAKCEDDNPKFETEITPHIPTGHMRTMIRVAYAVGWYTHEQNSKEEWTIPQV